MAYQVATPRSLMAPLHGCAEGVGSFLRKIGVAMITNSSGNKRLQQVERLNAKTDVELAELGIKRDDIVRFVFRDLYIM